jgi:NAD-dependent SIR2 family protein deacetylase
LADPRWFHDDPTLAWGFYGHRFNLYRVTRPHEGFHLLKKWAQRLKHGAFVFTSNVDGQFQRAGFDPNRIVEVHGAIDWLQCVQNCGHGLFTVEPDLIRLVEVEETTMRAREPLPSCPGCGRLARPNILLFGDGDWDESRTAEQRARLSVWLRGLDGARLVVIECGAGTAIPTVRHFCDALAVSGHATLIRINPREAVVPSGQISLALPALPALRLIEEQVQERQA